MAFSTVIDLIPKREVCRLYITLQSMQTGVMTIKINIKPLILLLVTGMLAAKANAFPEIPFCPLGGPPGWMHRILDRHGDHRHSGLPYPAAYYSESYSSGAAPAPFQQPFSYPLPPDRQPYYRPEFKPVPTGGQQPMRYSPLPSFPEHRHR